MTDLNEALDEFEKVKAERDRYKGAINWAMGCSGDFRERSGHEGLYYWRTELAKRASLKYNLETCQYEALAGKEGGMKEHKLKTWPVLFADVEAGVKTFEIRKNDRNFRTGDILVLQEYEPSTNQYSGREISVVVNYSICLDGLPGLDGFIGMSIENIP